jgi:NAD(P)-dependent dehydrogenase (short-subunit alcohol dehydrogenase family)
MEQVDFTLNEKVGVITGGAQGIGFTMAQALSSVGADVAIADIQNKKARSSIFPLFSVFWVLKKGLSTG